MFKVPINAFWRHPQTRTHLELIAISWQENSPKIQLDLRSLRLHQPGTWSLTIDASSTDAADLIKTLQDHRKIAYSLKFHPLTIYLLSSLIDYLQSRQRSTTSPGLDFIQQNYK